MKKIVLFLIFLLVIFSFTYVTLAKPKKAKHKPPKKHPHSTPANIEFIEETFNIKNEKLNHLINFDLEPEELSLAFYLYSVSNRPINDKGIQFIAKHKGDWNKITWYFGFPPIMFEDEIIKFRHSPTSRQLFLPFGRSKYKDTLHHGTIKEKIEVKHNKYKYIYRNKQLGIKQKIEIKHNKYKYHYTNKQLEIQEKLQVKYPSYRYTYHYRNQRTNEKIKKTGKGRPLTPGKLHRKLKERRRKESKFHLSIRININL